MCDENILIHKTRSEWIKQARDAMYNAEEYGALKIEDMREPEKSLLRQALDALGQDVRF